MTFMERQRDQKTDKIRQEMGRRERRRVEKILEKRRAANVGASDLDGFQAQLVRRHGNIMRAWKESLDPERNGQLCFSAFCQRARDEGFRGNTNKLWKELDADGN